MHYVEVVYYYFWTVIYNIRVVHEENIVRLRLLRFLETNTMSKMNYNLQHIRFSVKGTFAFNHYL